MLRKESRQQKTCIGSCLLLNDYAESNASSLNHYAHYEKSN
jgi:hypothetical protein